MFQGDLGLAQGFVLHFQFHLMHRELMSHLGGCSRRWLSERFLFGHATSIARLIGARSRRPPDILLSGGAASYPAHCFFRLAAAKSDYARMPRLIAADMRLAHAAGPGRRDRDVACTFWGNSTQAGLAGRLELCKAIPAGK